MSGTVTQSVPRLRTLAVAQALVLLVALGAPITALAAVDAVSPGSLPQGATSQPITITGSGFNDRCSTYSVTFSGSGVSATGVARSSRTRRAGQRASHLPVRASTAPRHGVAPGRPVHPRAS